MLISDVRMKGMNGLELTRLLRTEGSVMPIILMTGYNDALLRNAAADAGADMVIEKPVPLSVISTEIARMNAGGCGLAHPSR